MRVLALLTMVAAAWARVSSAQEVARELALADRGPRFLYAVSSRAEPVEVDVSKNAMLRQLVKLDLERPTVGALLSAIERQAGLRFAFDRAAVPVGQSVALKAEAITVAAALTAILADAGVDVLLSSRRQVVLVRRPPRPGPDEQGSITGKVIDKRSGEAIVGATIAVDRTNLGATSGDDGGYRIDGVPAGSYSVQARYIGYAPAVAAVTVTAEREATVDFALIPHAVPMDEIVVAGTIVEARKRELPVPVGVLSEQQIQTPSRTRIEELFRGDVPGIVGLELSPTNVGSQLFVRGRASLDLDNLVKIYIDGVEVPTSQLISALDLQNIKRVELLRGPQASTIYGSNASGGVLLLFTKEGIAGPPRLSGSLSAGTTASDFVDDTPFATQNRLNLSGGGPGFTYSMGGSFSSTDAFFQQGDTRQAGFTGRAVFTHGPVRVGLTTMLSQRTLGFVDPPESAILAPVLPQFALPNNIDIAMTQELVGVSATYAPNERWETTLILGSSVITDRGHQYAPEGTTPDDTTYNQWVEPDRQLSARLHSTLSLQPSASVRSTTTVGVEAARSNAQYLEVDAYDPAGEFQTPVPFSGAVTPQRITSSRGAFVQEVLGIKDRLFLTGALRAEYNSNLGENNRVIWAPRVGVAYPVDLGPALALKPRASYGKSVRAPDPSQAGGSRSEFGTQIANPDLRPEVQRGFDAGFDLELENGRLVLEATYFDQTAEDLIEQTVLEPGDPDAGTVDIVQYQNVGEVTNRGIELGMRARFGPADLTASYTYAKHEVKSLAPDYQGLLVPGDELTFAPRSTGGGTLGLNLPSLVGAVGGKSARVEFGLTYIGERITEDNIGFLACAFGLEPCIDDTPEQRDYWIKAEGFVKYRLAVSHPIRPWLDAFVNVDNVGNRQVPEFFPYYPSRGRAVLIGVRFGE